MATATRQTKTFSLDSVVLDEIHKTKGTASASERVNSLLKLALKEERRQLLEREAAAFFSEQASQSQEQEHDAFHTASVASLTRDSE